MTVKEFREILEDVSHHIRLLNPIDLETFAYYLLHSLGRIGVLSEATSREEYLRAIYDLLDEQEGTTPL